MRFILLLGAAGSFWTLRRRILNIYRSKMHHWWWDAKINWLIGKIELNWWQDNWTKTLSVVEFGISPFSSRSQFGFFVQDFGFISHFFFNLGIQLIQRKKPFFWSSIKSVDFRRFWQAGDRLLLLFSTVWFVVLGMIPWVFIDVTFQSCCRPIWEEKITSEADYILAAGVKIEFLRLRRRSFKKHNS